MAVFVLMGSGEFLPWAREPDGWALEAAGADSDRVVVAPLAAAPEGDEVFAEWARMGTEHFESLGMKVDVLGARTRADADDPDLARSIEGARYVFFSGGNPGYLAQALAGTALWRAVLEAVSAGTALGGCSAGMVALGVMAPDTAASGAEAWKPGLNLFTKGFLNAHWDALDGYRPGLTRLILDMWPRGSVLFALDEDTAAFGDGERWKVTGSGGLTIPGLDGLERIPGHGEIVVDLGLSL